MNQPPGYLVALPGTFAIINTFRDPDQQDVIIDVTYTYLGLPFHTLVNVHVDSHDPNETRVQFVRRHGGRINNSLTVSIDTETNTIAGIRIDGIFYSVMEGQAKVVFTIE